MASHIKKCVVCSSYTLERMHCESSTIIPKPPKFSPEDKYGKYRREEKKKEWAKVGLY